MWATCLHFPKCLPQPCLWLAAFHAVRSSALTDTPLKISNTTTDTFVSVLLFCGAQTWRKKAKVVLYLTQNQHQIRTNLPTHATCNWMPNNTRRRHANTPKTCPNSRITHVPVSACQSICVTSSYAHIQIFIQLFVWQPFMNLSIHT